MTVKFNEIFMYDKLDLRIIIKNFVARLKRNFE